MQEKPQMRAPPYIRMRDEDNVAIVANQDGLHPGAGGLSNIVEKAMGSVIKSGTSPIAGVLVAGRTGA